VISLIRDLEDQKKKWILSIPRASAAEKEIDDLGLDPTAGADLI